MKRIARFGGTGVLCLALQYSVLRALQSEGLPPAAAVFVGYCVSAQLNFVLSYSVTWSDSARRHGAALLATWASFNGACVASALVNTGVYAICRQDAGDVVALGLATVTSTTLNYVMNHFVVLRPERDSRDALA
jgi:putative flippase GtrA